LLKDLKPARLDSEAAENEGVFLSVETGLEMFAGLGRGEGGRDAQAALGVEGDDHGGMIPRIGREANKRGKAGIRVLWDYRREGGSLLSLQR